MAYEDCSRISCLLSATVLGTAITPVDFRYGSHGVALAWWNGPDLATRERRARPNVLVFVSQLVEFCRYRLAGRFGDPLFA